MEKRYYPFSSYLKETFGKKVYKITLDGAFIVQTEMGQFQGAAVYFVMLSGVIQDVLIKLFQLKIR